MLKVLLLKKQIDNKRKELDSLRSKDFAQKEAELEQAISEVENDEQRSAIEEMVNAFEAEMPKNR